MVKCLRLLPSTFLSKGPKIKVQKIIYFPFVEYGCETWFLPWSEQKITGRFSRKGCWGRNTNRRGSTLQEAANVRIIRNIIIFIPRQILERWQNKGWDRWNLISRMEQKRNYAAVLLENCRNESPCRTRRNKSILLKLII